MKFTSGLVTGLICGTILTVIISITPNLLNRSDVIDSGDRIIKEVEWKKAVFEDERSDRFHQRIAAALDENAQGRWKEITSDPTWHTLTSENKMEIWRIFKKSYAPAK